MEGRTLSVVCGPSSDKAVESEAVAPRAREQDQELAAEFGRRVRAARLEAGFTQEVLAERAGLHATYISNLERGYSAPTLGVIVRVAEGLGIDPGTIVENIHSR